MKRFTILFTLLLALALAAAQCGGAAPTTAPPAEPTKAEPAKEEPAKEEPTKEGEPAKEEPAKEEPTKEGEPAKEEPAKEEEEEAVAPSGVEEVVVIGFTASKTGAQEVSSTSQTHGMELWLEQVNEKGIVLSDGTTVKFEFKSYDDESTKERVQLLYTTLINDDQADFLISPYSSGLTDAAAVVAETSGKVMITTGAASDDTYKKGLTKVFQLYTPASRYLTGAIDLLAATDPEAKKIAFVYENDKFSEDVVNQAKVYAEEKGFEVVLFEGYDKETTDFAPILNKVISAAPDAIMGGGHFNDGQTLARQINEKAVPVKFLALLVAPPDLKFAELGDAALGVIGPSQWEPQASYSPEAAEAAGIEWFGPTVAEFTDAFVSANGEEPTYHAAGGFAAGLALGKAIKDADSVDPDAVKAALDEMDILTFYGQIKFDTTAEAHGLQAAHSMVYVQWQKDDAGTLVKQVVWPAEGKSADAIPLGGAAEGY
jgi:branched-chain amino acid transport system substrate-binding protein